jgi:hypothetical protein
MPMVFAPIAGLLGTIGSTIGAGGIGGILAKVVLTVATTALQMLLTPKPEAPRPDTLRDSQPSEEGPGRWAIGRVQLEGRISFGDTKDLNIMRVILHAFGRIDAVEEVIYDGRPIVVEADGAVSSPPYVSEDGTYSFVNVFTKVGDGTETAWEELLAYFPERWTSDHRIRGIAQSLLWIKSPGIDEAKFSGLFGGGIKDLRLVARMQRPYDPRTGTYGWTQNGVVCCMWIRLQLPGTTLADFHMASLATMADEADVLVPILDGDPEPRSRVSGGGEGQITTEVVAEFYRCAGLEEVRSADGKIAFRWLDDYPAAEVTLRSTGSYRHIQEMQIKMGPDGGRRPNVAKVKFLSPERQYIVSEIPIQEFDGPGGNYVGPDWARVQDEIDLYGEQEKVYEFKYCPSASQAQRLARREFHMDRAVIAELLTGFAVIGLWGVRTVDVEIPEVGVDGASETKRARLADAPRVNDAAGTGDVVLKIIPEILQTAWDPDEDEMPPPPPLTLSEYESDIRRPDAPTSAVAVNSGGWSVVVNLPAAPAGAETAEANFRHYTAGPDLPSEWTEMTETGMTSASAPGDFRGVQCEFRWRVFNEANEGSYFSPVLVVESLEEA